MEIATFEQAQTFDPTLEISALNWNTLCWFGSLHGYSANVLKVCEQAVNLASEEKLDSHRDSRGLARAFTGNIPGAIEDFKFFIEHTDNDEQKQQRQDWVVELNAGRDPFTPEVIEMLFDQ